MCRNSASFTFVGLDPLTGRPTRINPLEVETAEEQAGFDEGEARYEVRKQARKAGHAVQDGTECSTKLTELLQRGQTKAELPRSQPG